jgi:hypothetical protein
VKTCAAIAAFLLLSGCQTAPRIRTANTQAQGTPKQDRPVTVAEARTTYEIPAQSVATLSPEGVLTFTPAAPITVVTTSTRADTGGTSPEVANAQIDSARKEALAKRQMTVGIGLLVAGALIAFALPAGMRWPIAGVCIAACGLALIILRDPPTWLIAILGTAALAVPLGFLLTHKRGQTQ